jgi:hypothetical protein
MEVLYETLKYADNRGRILHLYNRVHGAAAHLQ